jgi:hypothetical protein
MASDLPVVAIVAAFNEADIVGATVRDLIAQGVQVYFLDDGSTDGTVETIEPLVGAGVLAIERLRAPADSGPFDWQRVLRRKAELARELDASWFIHHDADEFRESPWAHLTLREAIQSVDDLGFNAIDFESLDFWPVDGAAQPDGDVRRALPFYAKAAPYDRLQIRCWKKTDAAVDLASSGGHEARFDGRRVCPLRFILRHYPIRGQAHGERKVFRERRDRLRAEERALGWHVQYDGWREGASFIRDRSTLTTYDADAVRVALTLRHRGVEELEASLEETRGVADTRVRDVEASKREIETLKGELDARDRQLDTHRREIAEAARALAESNNALAVTNDELGQSRADLAAARADIAALRVTVDHQAQQIEGLGHAVAEGRRRLDEFHRSLSWRWMSPARAVYRVLTGR